MGVRRGRYPQVDPRAAGLMTRAVSTVPASLPIAKAARVVRRRQARLVLARVGSGWGGATPTTLERALRLGLGQVGLKALLWGGPVVDLEAPEVVVRRLLGPANPFVTVLERGSPVGAVLREGPRRRDGLRLSVAAALAGLEDWRGSLLRRAGAVGSDLGRRVAVVGGLVRDLLLSEAPPDAGDVDLVVEGEASVLASRLAGLVGGDVVRHDAFLTATIRLPGGQHVDVVTARRERYARPGALPEVAPGSLADDLLRRDFTVNALAARLDGAAWGEVVDPAGGLADLRRRRLRVLHPLSFIEDPTRVFRALRFAERLRFGVAATTCRLLAEAVRLSVYDALSGDRIRQELDAIVTEPRPDQILQQLGKVGAFRLLLPEYHFSRVAAALLRQIPRRVAELPLAGETLGALYVLALTVQLGPTAFERWADRLALPAPARARLRRARLEADGLLARLGGAADSAEAYVLLQPWPETVVAWARVRARSSRARRQIAAYLGQWRDVQPLLRGDDLTALGFVPGPEFARLLAGLTGEQVAGRVRDRTEAVAWLGAAAPQPGRERTQAHPAQRGG